MRQSTQFRQTGTNLKRARNHNHSVVLDVIRKRGPISRSDLSKVTALSRQTIQNIVGELEASDMVRMAASEIKGRGHPGVDISLNPESAFSMGVHVDRFTVRTVVCDLSGSEIWSDTYYPERPNAAVATSLAIGALSDFRNAHESRYTRLVGIGLAAPGPFEMSSSTSTVTEFPEIGSVANIAALEERTSLPIVLENDATAASIGELLYGTSPHPEGFAFLMFGFGLGAGYIFDGLPYRGASGNAGEIGHISTDSNGLICHCGKRGCFEQYLSQNALCQLLNIPLEALAIEATLAERISEGGQIVDDWFRNAASKLHELTDIIDLTVNPGEIVIGGTASPILLEQLFEAFQRSDTNQKTFPLKNASVRLGTAGPYAVALGAAAASMEAHFFPSLSQLLL